MSVVVLLIYLSAYRYESSTYITEYRIRRAKDLLEYGGIPVAEIAECVGYVDCFILAEYLKSVRVYLPQPIAS